MRQGVKDYSEATTADEAAAAEGFRGASRRGTAGVECEQPDAPTPAAAVLPSEGKAKARASTSNPRVAPAQERWLVGARSGAGAGASSKKSMAVFVQRRVRVPPCRTLFLPHAGAQARSASSKALKLGPRADAKGSTRA